MALKAERDYQTRVGSNRGSGGKLDYRVVRGFSCYRTGQIITPRVQFAEAWLRRGLIEEIDAQPEIETAPADARKQKAHEGGPLSLRYGRTKIAESGDG